MGRGVSYGGGHSSLGYLFGSSESSNHNSTPPPQASRNRANETKPGSPEKMASTTSSSSLPIDKQMTPAGIRGSPTNNYVRTDGQNCGNFLTDRPFTKIHAAPGGGSSLGYLFGGGSTGN